MGYEGISKRLDQFLATESLIQLFNRHRSWDFPSMIFDYFPIHFEWDDLSFRTNYPFKFNHVWMVDDDLCKMVREHWNNIEEVSKLAGSLERHG